MSEVQVGTYIRRPHPVGLHHVYSVLQCPPPPDHNRLIAARRNCPPRSLFLLLLTLYFSQKLFQAGQTYTNFKRFVDQKCPDGNRGVSAQASFGVTPIGPNVKVGKCCAKYIESTRPLYLTRHGQFRLIRVRLTAI